MKSRGAAMAASVVLGRGLRDASGPNRRSVIKRQAHDARRAIYFFYLADLLETALSIGFSLTPRQIIVADQNGR